eukprot:TRINITY_DN6026_c0_g1_i1.p1 TRINITY_DN6026_c0_g1~~TRINITY_DN6026_c0_g1_i1.p1  ORF type:complete len:1112 (+),score=292.68 TRINITY_DN6026_c0_g1_i1:171-3506(+)
MGDKRVSMKLALPNSPNYSPTGSPSIMSPSGGGSTTPPMLTDKKKKRLIDFKGGAAVSPRGKEELSPLRNQSPSSPNLQPIHVRSKSKEKEKGVLTREPSDGKLKERQTLEQSEDDVQESPGSPPTVGSTDEENQAVKKNSSDSVGNPFINKMKSGFIGGKEENREGSGIFKGKSSTKASGIRKASAGIGLSSTGQHKKKNLLSEEDKIDLERRLIELFGIDLVRLDPKNDDVLIDVVGPEEDKEEVDATKKPEQIVNRKKRSNSIKRKAQKMKQLVNVMPSFVVGSGPTDAPTVLSPELCKKQRALARDRIQAVCRISCEVISTALYDTWGSSEGNSLDEDGNLILTSREHNVHEEPPKEVKDSPKVEITNSPNPDSLKDKYKPPRNAGHRRSRSLGSTVEMARNEIKKPLEQTSLTPAVPPPAASVIKGMTVDKTKGPLLNTDKLIILFGEQTVSDIRDALIEMANRNISLSTLIGDGSEESKDAAGQHGRFYSALFNKGKKPSSHMSANSPAVEKGGRGVALPTEYLNYLSGLPASSGSSIGADLPKQRIKSIPPQLWDGKATPEATEENESTTAEGVKQHTKQDAIEFCKTLIIPKEGYRYELGATTNVIKTTPMICKLQGTDWNLDDEIAKEENLVLDHADKDVCFYKDYFVNKFGRKHVHWMSLGATDGPVIITVEHVGRQSKEDSDSSRELPTPDSVEESNNREANSKEANMSRENLKEAMGKENKEGLSNKEGTESKEPAEVSMDEGDKNKIGTKDMVLALIRSKKGDERQIVPLYPVEYFAHIGEPNFHPSSYKCFSSDKEVFKALQLPENIGETSAPFTINEYENNTATGAAISSSNSASNSNRKFVKVKDPEGVLSKELADFEIKNKIRGYKFGILHAKEGQFDENIMFSNQDDPNDPASQSFQQLLSLLGTKITLNGWTGGNFKGGLDTKHDATGKYSLHTKFKGFEVMFHVSTFLPYSNDDLQQLERKRHLGNDIVVIVFQSGSTPFPADCIKSEFNHVFIIIQRENPSIKCVDPAEEKYKIGVFNKEGVRGYGPTLPFPALIKGKDLRVWLLTKCINGERAALYAPGFKGKLERTRGALLKDIIEKYCTKRDLAKIK